MIARLLSPELRRPVAVGAAAILVIVALLVTWPSGQSSPQRTAGELRVSGWAPYWQTRTALDSVVDNAALVSDVSLVTHSSRGVDEIVPYEGLPADAVDRYRDELGRRGISLVATVFDDTDSGTMAGILADPTQRARHVDALVELVRDGGFDGLEIDYEQFAFADPRATWTATRPNWIAFLEELATRLRPLGRTLMVAVPPVYGDGGPDDPGYWVYDHAAMGVIVDRIRIMAYDYSFSSPGPVAPIDWVGDVVEALSALVPPERLDLGIPTYGYDWVLSVTGTCPADQTPSRRAISIARAERLQAERGITSVWDGQTAERRFDYVDTLTGTSDSGAATTCSVARTVSYVDPAGVFERARLAHTADWHGVSLWALGNENTATWDALESVVTGDDTWPGATAVPSQL